MKAKIILTLQCLFIVSYAFCQEKPVHPKKVYVSADKKIFFNKNLPVYFWVSSSPDPNSSRYLLPSEATPQYANPMYFDTEGRNTLRSPSAVDTVTKKPVSPEIDIQFQVYADGVAPESKMAIQMKSSFLRDKITHTAGATKIAFSAKDEFSGVEGIMVSVDHSPFKLYTDSLLFEQEKKYFIQYYAYDYTGNAEDVHSYEFIIDNSAPISAHIIKGIEHNSILPGNTTIELSAVDSSTGVKKIFFSLDSGVYHIYNTKFHSSNFAQGNHLLKYYAEDLVGNKEAEHSYEFYIDMTPPQVIEEILGKTFIANGREYSAGTSKLKLSAFDNKAGVKEIYYSINNAAFELYDKPVVLSNFNGNMLIRSYAVDWVGNKSISDINGSRKNNLAYIDLGAPWVGYTFVGPNLETRDTVFINHKTQLRLNAKDSESGIQKIEYQIDSSEIMLYQKELTISQEGFHRIAIFGYDNTDNLTRQTFEVLVDTTGPEIFERFGSISLGSLTIDSISIPVYPSSVVLFLSATDEKSGYDNLVYSLNGDVFKPYLRDIRNLASGRKNTLKIISTDRLGNKSFREIEFYIK